MNHINLKIIALLIRMQIWVKSQDKIKLQVQWFNQKIVRIIIKKVE
jgi:translation initiation factor IF-1